MPPLNPPGAWVRTWRSPEELAGGLPDTALAEFAEAFGVTEASRRQVLKIMAASLALGAVSSCGDASDPSGVAVPYVNQPEQQIPGRPRYYATATLLEGFAQPVLVETHEGRPTKIEGNPDHPVGRGGTDAFIQAAVLQLYDPDRSQTVQHLGRIATWGHVEAAFADLRRRLDETGGAGLRLLTGDVTSPTLSRQLDRLQARWPQARWHGFEPVGSDLRHTALRQTFGARLAAHYALERAHVVVALDEDLLGPGPAQVRHADGWASRRRAALAGDGACRLMVAEPTPTLTGAMAESRLPVSAARIGALASALAARLRSGGAAAPQLSLGEEAWVAAAAQALQENHGRALVAVGAHQPAEVQAIGLHLNQTLGNLGATLVLTDPVARPVAEGQDLLALSAAIGTGDVETLLLLDVNPTYTAPAHMAFPQLLQQVPLRLHVGLFADETAALCHWHLPLSHPLESWGDARAVDGTVTLLQPTVRPLYETRSGHEVLALLLAEGPTDGLAIVRDTWQTHLDGWADDPAAQEELWRSFLRAGFIPDTALQARRPALAGEPAAALPESPGAEGIEIVFRPDPCVWDGRFANCAWLQELPKPLTKLTWDTIAAVSPSLAADGNIRTGDLVRVTAGTGSLEAPAWVLPGQAERTVTLYLGYGRTRAGRVGSGVGYDAYRLRRWDQPWMLRDAAISPSGSAVPLATTQHHDTTAGHPIVRTVALRELQADAGAVHHEAPRQPSLYRPWPEGDPAWAMSIDVDLCIGCNACVIACQAENNVPVVGREQVAGGREMHWLRIDRYYNGPPENPGTTFMPIPCMHCEKAPCEVGCPVNATVHGNGGLNEMVYNRCIGTRTCSSYCPYKVRRFNWFDFTGDASPQVRAQRNPDVTVRARGVMEKCTYCIQRISAASRQARVENRPIGDGEVVPACQQACPTTAIMFGNAADAGTRVSQWKQSSREYGLLEHLGTRPRTTYLARVTTGEPRGES
ncbi:MAG: 4Fe-4S dicluster domain-containing protein [Rhodospirillales bacterium]|nr:4Fe-4S dicluster domain-containing protein [Rhodospirillales bacterium]